MKKRTLTLLTAVVMLLAMAACGSQNNDDKQTATMDTNEPSLAGGLRPFDVQKDFADNGFTFFTKNLILCSGDSTESNAMTIGWGSIGNYIGHDRAAVTVYVAPARYTHEFMERHKRFTIMEFDNPKVWQYMGKYSGRDCEGAGDRSDGVKDRKAAALGLHVAYTPNGTPYYTEATTVIECETMTAWHQTEKDFRNDTPRQWYGEHSASGIHTVYIGEVLGAWRKDIR
ncbi:MAG: flavin reductase [Bacteroidales bacterium]|nr:flavin reductase [Bacteroidales bacterium]